MAVAAIAFASLTSFFITFIYDDLSQGGLLFAMILLGFSLGSIYHLVNITCCADLGKEQRGKQATATISGIIDGCGSLGTGAGMFSLGLLIDRFGYRWGFLFIITIALTLALIPLNLILFKDLNEIEHIIDAQKLAEEQDN